MKILTPSQLYEADKRTIENEGITSWQLMERASLKAISRIKELISINDKVCVLAGTGNNGGDGLAISYHLFKLGYKVEVIIFKYADRYAKDCQLNLDRLEKDTDVELNIISNQKIDFSFYSVFIDAVFGIGLNRRMPKFVEDNLRIINNIGVKKIAIDVPSGLSVSTLTPPDAVVFKACYTLTFQCPKLNFFLPHFGNYIGEVNVLDIGLDNAFIEDVKSNYQFITQEMVRDLINPRLRFTHKGTYGHLLLIGGQKGMMGSMVLSSKSAMRSGAGKVTVILPKCGIDILQTTCPEVMVMPSSNDKYVSTTDMSLEPFVVCIGMGLGQSEEARIALQYYLDSSENPMLIDADGLNIISNHRELIKKIPAKSILTPHQGELKRLLGEWKDDHDKIESVKQFSKTYDLIVVSKDAYSFVVYKEQVYINSTGNPGMATAGSGDVLAGLISGLVAQGYSTLNASILGVYIHGASGDNYASKYDQQSLIASDLIENFKEVFSLLKK